MRLKIARYSIPFDFVFILPLSQHDLLCQIWQSSEEPVGGRPGTTSYSSVANHATSVSNTLACFQFPLCFSTNRMWDAAAW